MNWLADTIRHARKRRGFTLVELLVTSGMLAMLASAGFAAFSAGTRSAIKSKRYTRMIAHGQAALRAITKDISSAVAHGDSPLTSLDAQFEGRDTDTIDFIVPRVKDILPEEGAGTLCEVGYYIDNDPDTEAQWLTRREDYTLDDDPLEGGMLAPAGPFVSELNLEFYDGLFWYDGWTLEEEFPAAIRIRIVVLDEDEIEEPMFFSTTVSVMAQ